MKKFMRQSFMGVIDGIPCVLYTRYGEASKGEPYKVNRWRTFNSQDEADACAIGEYGDEWWTD